MKLDINLELRFIHNRVIYGGGASSEWSAAGWMLNQLWILIADSTKLSSASFIPDRLPNCPTKMCLEMMTRHNIGAAQTQFSFLFYYTDFGQITCTLRDILYLLLQIFFASICPLPHIFFTLSCFAPINSHVISTKGHGNMIGSMCQGSHNMPENMLHAPKHVYITWGYSKVKKYGTKGRLGKKLQQYSLVLAALTTIMLVLFTTYLDSTLVAS